MHVLTMTTWRRCIALAAVILTASFVV